MTITAVDDAPDCGILKTVIPAFHDFILIEMVKMITESRNSVLLYEKTIDEYGQRDYYGAAELNILVR